MNGGNGTTPTMVSPPSPHSSCGSTEPNQEDNNNNNNEDENNNKNNGGDDNNHNNNHNNHITPTIAAAFVHNFPQHTGLQQICKPQFKT